MYFLNDDFDDRLYHLAIALERFNLNYGNIKEEIKQLSNLYNLSSLYKHENYISTMYIGKNN